MAVPSNFAALQGLSVISADNLNTTIQTVYNYAGLRAFSSAVANQVVYCMGASFPGDGGQAHYIWVPDATGPDNNETIIMPFGNIKGAWSAFFPLPNWARFGDFFTPWVPTVMAGQSAANPAAGPTVPIPGFQFSGYYTFLGLKTVWISFHLVLTNVGSAIGVIYFDLPPIGTPNLFSVGAVRENAVSGVMGQGLIFAQSNLVGIVRFDGASMLTNGFNLTGSVVYGIQ